MSWSADMHKSALMLDGDYFEIWLADMIFNIILPKHTKRNIIPCILEVKQSKLNISLS